MLKLFVYLSRAGHGSVWAGFCPFSYPTRASRVGEIPTHDSGEKLENRRVSSGSYRGFFGRVDRFMSGILGEGSRDRERDQKWGKRSYRVFWVRGQEIEREMRASVAPWTVTESERSAMMAGFVRVDVLCGCSKMGKKMGEGSRD